MKIVIVGGTSSLGKALKPVLSEFSDVVTMGRTGCDLKLDLLDASAEIAFPSGTDAVVHTAAHFGGTGVKEMCDAVTVNVSGSLRLCNAAIGSRIKHFVYISSMSACLPVYSPYYSIYALTKKQAEQACEYIGAKQGLKVAILRPTQIYGIEDSFRKHQPFIYAAIDNAKNNRDITIYGKRDALRNYLYADDLSEIIARVLKKQVVGTYPCMHAEDVRYRRVAEAAVKAFKSNSVIRFDPGKEDIPDNIFDKDFSLYDIIGYHPRFSIEDGLEEIKKSTGSAA